MGINTTSNSTIADRIFSRIRLVMDNPNQCWNWPGTRNNCGYGKVWHEGRMRYTHRVMYELHHGPIPAGKVVMHSCDNPACCNPAHLRVGTQADNMRDMFAKRRHPWARRGERKSRSSQATAHTVGVQA